MASVSHLEDKLASVTGEGSSLSYFVGFLKRVLPGLKTDIITWCQEYGIKESQTSYKFFIIIIRSSDGIYPDSLCDNYDNIIPGKTFVDDIKVSRAGDQSRKLTRSMYKIEDREDGNEYYICGELAGPLKTLRGIFDLVGSNKSTEQYKDEESKFVSTLKQLADIDVTRPYAEKFVVVDVKYEDELPDALLQLVKTDLKQRK